MEKTKEIYKVRWTSQFKKDYKKAIKRKYDVNFLQQIVRTIAEGKSLPEEYKDHQLSGNWINHRECHIQNDWLLIYQIQNDILVLELTRTGTHSDLFKK